MPLDSEHTAIVEGWRRHREAASRPILLRDDFGAVWVEVSARHCGVDGSARLEANGLANLGASSWTSSGDDDDDPAAAAASIVALEPWPHHVSP